MNKIENKLAFSVLATLATGIALIYTLIMYHRIMFAVFAVSILFLITAYILTQNIISYITMRNKSANVQVKNYIDDISHQLEAMNGIQSKLGRATYLYTRQVAEKITNLENNYTESQAALYKNLSIISNTQNKAAKLMIKYDLNNTTKLISTIKDMRNHLSETMVQGFDQIHPNNDEVVSALKDIVEYLKSQPQQMDDNLLIQLGDVASELQNISGSLKHIQDSSIITNPTAGVGVSFTATDSYAAVEASSPKPDIQPDVLEDTHKAISDITDKEEETDIFSMDDLETNTTDILSMDSLETDTADILSMDSLETNTTDILSTDTLETESFTPTFTVVGKSTDSQPQTDDSNRQLSADEIAALFAASEPAPKKEDVPAKKASVEPPKEDPNKQLSPDEIAALFAASEPAPKSDEKTEISNDSTLSAIATDPNKQLSPEEIAALFSSLG